MAQPHINMALMLQPEVGEQPDLRSILNSWKRAFSKVYPPVACMPGVTARAQELPLLLQFAFALLSHAVKLSHSALFH